MKTTEGIRSKPYKCSVCGFKKDIETNHYGECYSLFNYNHCPDCPTTQLTTWICHEVLPEGFTKPEPWTVVKLGDVAEIIVKKTKKGKRGDSKN